MCYEALKSQKRSRTWDNSQLCHYLSCNSVIKLGGKYIRTLDHFIPVHFSPARKKLLYRLLIKFGIHIKPVSVIETCLDETCIKVHKGRHSSAEFHVQNCLKQEIIHPYLFSNLLYDMSLRMFKGSGEIGIQGDISTSGPAWLCQITGQKYKYRKRTKKLYYLLLRTLGWKQVLRSLRTCTLIFCHTNATKNYNKGINVARLLRMCYTLQAD
jgi:hypothetical protein